MAVEGFVYVSDQQPGPMAGAAVGTRVAKASVEPPWIVVDHSIERVLVPHWPGRLFRVAVPPATDEQREAMAKAAAELRPDAGYTRALAVDVLEELPAAALFGPHGEAVLRVLEAGRSLTEQAAQQLASARATDADSAYQSVWERWLSGQPTGSAYQRQDHSRTLATPGAGRSGSPIGKGLVLLYHVVHDRAKQQAGAGAVLIDEEGEEVLAEPWSSGLSALLDAALAFGAPDLADAPTRAALTASWDSGFGQGSAQPGQP